MRAVFEEVFRAVDHIFKCGGLDMDARSTNPPDSLSLEEICLGVLYSDIRRQSLRHSPTPASGSDMIKVREDVDANHGLAQ